MSASQKFIPLSVPNIGRKEEELAIEAIRSSWISGKGKYVDRFEEQFASLCGGRDAISVTNGTSALHLALAALDVQPGDEIIIPSLSFIATANAVRYVGADPVFVDIDPRTWCIDPTSVEPLITPSTKGIIAVHLYGHPADMDALNDIAKRRGLWLIEDASQAHLARYKKRPVGGLATAATFSFYGNKILTSGEGGAVVVKDARLAARCRLLRGQGMDPDRQYYFPEIGYNFRLTNIACALLCAQIERAEHIISRRQQVFDGYQRRLSGLKGVGFQPVEGWAKRAPWLFCLTIQEEIFGHSRDDLMLHLRANHIETRPFFIPIHTLPPYRSDAGQMLPVTVRVASQGVNLPTYAGLTESDLDRITDTIASMAR